MSLFTYAPLIIDISLGQFMPDLGILEGKAISHSLSEFAFSKDAFRIDEATFFRDNTVADDDDDDDGNEGFGMDIDNSAQPAEDFFAADPGNDDYSGGGIMGGNDFEGDHHSNGSTGPTGDGDTRNGQFVPFDPSRAPNERDLVMAMTDADGDTGTMDYFDQNFMKNWAGPEHWKLRKVARRSECRLVFQLVLHD